MTMAPVEPLDAVQKALAKAKAIREKAAAAGRSLLIICHGAHVHVSCEA